MSNDINIKELKDYSVKKETYQSFINALPYSAAILNEKGIILCVNELWKEFGENNGLSLNNYGIGYNYVKISEQADGEDADLGAEAAAGIKAVISGEMEIFSLEYPCHSESKRMWFKMKAKAFKRGALVLHENITDKKLNKIELEQQLNKAKNLHLNSLPRDLPELDGLEVYAYYQPEYEMGGDHYNFIRCGNQLLFYISDVTGHGLDAAILSSFVKDTVKNYVSMNSDENENFLFTPGKVLAFLFGQYQSEGYPADYFIEILLGIIDLEENELCYSSAGSHVPLLLLECRDQLRRLEVGGLPISTTFSATVMDFSEKKVKLKEGAALFVSSDGLIEQKAGNERYNEYYWQVLAEYGHLPPRAIAEELNRDYCNFAGSLKADDDITYLIFQVLPKECYPILELEIGSEVAEIERAEVEIREFISSQFNNVDEAMMALHELLINAVEHGNDFDPEKKVKIKCLLREEYLMIEVEDEGKGFDWETKLGNITKDKEVIKEEQVCKGRGLGCILTNSAVDYYYYNNKGNRATITLKN